MKSIWNTVYRKAYSNRDLEWLGKGGGVVEEIYYLKGFNEARNKFQHYSFVIWMFFFSTIDVQK